MIEDRRHVANELAELTRRLGALTEWMSAPCEPFPADAIELGKFTGHVTLLLLSDGCAPGDSPASSEGMPQ